MVRLVATLLAATIAVAAIVACAPGAAACDLDDLADTSDRMQTPWEIAGYVVGADGERRRVLVGLSASPVLDAEAGLLRRPDQPQSVALRAAHRFWFAY